VTRPVADVAAVLGAAEAGATIVDIAERTGVPITTVQRWLAAGRAGLAARRAVEHEPDACPHRTGLPPAAYSYLLGVYLGDGALCRNGTRALRLEIACDARYPQLIEEIGVAIEAVLPVTARCRRHGANCIFVTATSVHWRCLLPQHGTGRKHHRSIVLEPWQEATVRAEPQPFVRGLIHTDGWRGINRVRHYEYTRYMFSNRSEDILRLFAWGCGLVGVTARRTTASSMAVSRREDVARLDEFIGPKS
jgi:hypothetical protein